MRDGRPKVNWRAAANLLTRDEDRRIAINELPEFKVTLTGAAACRVP
jgi:hypothetical protein